ncbi:hypothetical protein D9M69_577840 [compost metagenome]
MLGQFEEVAAAQAGRIAVALGQAVVGAVAFQGALAEPAADVAVLEAAGVVVVFEVGLRVFLRRPVLGFHQQARPLEPVVAAGHPAGAGRQAQAEALDHRSIGHQAAVLLVGHRRQAREPGLVVGEHQQVAVGAEFVVVMNPPFFAQPVDEVQVGFVVLGAVVAGQVELGVEVEAVGVGEDAVVLEDPGDDLRHS